jgi:hypothetical protein
MKKIESALARARLFSFGCASMRMTPEEKARQERIDMYLNYSNESWKRKSLTDEELKKLDELKKKTNAFDKVYWVRLTNQVRSTVPIGREGVHPEAFA